MTTYIKLNGDLITSVVTASVAPVGYVSVPVEIIPNDLFKDLTAYTFDGQDFHRRVVSAEEEREKALIHLRIRRDKLLSACDWTQMPDAPVDRDAWAAYRQALRDMPANTSDPANPVWPSKPN